MLKSLLVQVLNVIRQTHGGNLSVLRLQRIQYSLLLELLSLLKEIKFRRQLRTLSPLSLIMLFHFNPRHPVNLFLLPCLKVGSVYQL